MTRPNPYVSVSMAPEIRADLNNAVLALSAQVGRKLTISDVARAYVAVSKRHPDEVLAELTQGQEGRDE